MKIIFKLSFFSKMIVNSSKTTLPVFRVAIAYNDEQGFSIISKIIQLFRWMKINIIFEPIEIAGQNYQKKMIYGIDEENLSHLKKTNILLHTPFDYSFFDKNTQFNVEKYLNIALQNCFIKTYSNTEDGNKEIIEKLYETNFFSKNKQYVENINDYNKYTALCNQNFSAEILKNVDFYKSFGAKYTIFALNNFNDKTIIKFVIEMLKYFNMVSQFKELKSCNNIDEAIELLKKQEKNFISEIKVQEIHLLPEIKLKDMEIKLPSKLTNIETKLEGKFQICKLVEAIKERQIKLPDDYELYQIFANDVEYYPNINFWEETVIDPTVILRRKEV